jgi:hypothetical protein
VKRDNNFSGPISEFIRDKYFGIAKIVSFLNIWYKNRSVPKDFITVRYEDIMENQVGEFLKIAQFMDFPIDLKAAKETKEFSAFENMKSLEKNGKLSVDGRFGPFNQSDNDSYKARKGKIGGFVDYLNSEDVQFLTDYIDTNLNPYFGYTHHLNEIVRECLSL